MNEFWEDQPAYDVYVCDILRENANSAYIENTPKIVIYTKKKLMYPI